MTTAMTEGEFVAERNRIRETYGSTGREAAALADQALAALFLRSGWTQEQLAKVEGCTQSRMAKNLRFGRFLAFSPTGTIPRNLSERRFRSYWEQTDKGESNERIRFCETQRLMAEDIRLHESPANRPDVSGPIREHFADGKWHKLETIISRVDRDRDDVVNVLHRLCKGERKGYVAEKKQVGKSFSYRIFRIGKTVPYEVLMQDLGPIIEGLKTEGKKNVATISPGTVAHLAHQLEQLLEKLAK